MGAGPRGWGLGDHSQAQPWGVGLEGVGLRQALLWRLRGEHRGNCPYPSVPTGPFSSAVPCAAALEQIAALRQVLAAMQAEEGGLRSSLGLFKIEQPPSKDLQKLEKVGAEPRGWVPATPPRPPHNPGLQVPAPTPQYGPRIQASMSAPKWVQTPVIWVPATPLLPYGFRTQASGSLPPIQAHNPGLQIPAPCIGPKPRCPGLCLPHHGPRTQASRSLPPPLPPYGPRTQVSGFPLHPHMDPEPRCPGPCPHPSLYGPRSQVSGSLPCPIWAQNLGVQVSAPLLGGPRT